jgi:hypothetical protein
MPLPRFPNLTTLVSAPKARQPTAAAEASSSLESSRLAQPPPERSPWTPADVSPPASNFNNPGVCPVGHDNLDASRGDFRWPDSLGFQFVAGHWRQPPTPNGVQRASR